MEIEHTVRMFPIDGDMQKSVDELVKAGWEVTPGVPPVAVYHLVRVKPQANPGIGAFGKLSIDDDKIMIIPAGAKSN